MGWSDLATIADGQPGGPGAAEDFHAAHLGPALAAAGWGPAAAPPPGDEASGGALDNLAAVLSQLGVKCLAAPPGSALHGRLVLSLVHAVRRWRWASVSHAAPCTLCLAALEFKR